ncbi:MAG: GNAT family N-acetyltransferase [Spirochaetales bacterium]|nr:GNAT family N-acetyltransferase [Spirochaetales bacterium]
MIKLIKARESDLDELTTLYHRCVDDLNSRGIRQWDKEVYPNRQTQSASIKRGHQYRIGDEDRLIGAVVLNETQAEEWAAVDWQFNDKTPLVIHALVIAPEAQGQGYGKKVLTACEDFARQEGYQFMRLDVYPGNPAALRLYEKYGYLQRGKVSLAYKPPGHREYYCYEKKL